VRSFISNQNPDPAQPLGTRPPLHPLEAALLAVTGLHLCFLPWALGTMHLWSQLTSLGFSFVGFFLALLPRREASGWSSPSPAARSATARLHRQPVFWAGLVVLGYIAAQGLNPAWHYESDADSWWLEPVVHVAWLPAGIDVPFPLSGPGRSLVIFGSLWLLLCSVTVGFLRRHSYRVLFTLLAGNALGLALLGLLQVATGTTRIFWVYLPSNSAFSSSFIYPNHAGAYLNLMVALATGLALWSYRRARHGLEKISLAALYTLVAAGAGLMVIFSCSRGSIIMLLAFTLFSTVAHALRLMRRRSAAGSTRPEILPLVLTFAAFLGTVLVSFNTDKVWNRFAEMLANPVAAAQDRRVAREAATEMLADRWVLGWGAGGFRHAFPLYAQKHPAIYLAGGEGRKLWEHAHNDLIEFPLELGLVGLLPVLFVIGHGVWQGLRRRGRRNAVTVLLLLGCGLLLLHAGVDFVLQNPAVLLTAGVLFVAQARWAELDELKPTTPPGEARRDSPAASS